MRHPSRRNPPRRYHAPTKLHAHVTTVWARRVRAFLMANLSVFLFTCVADTVVHRFAGDRWTVVLPVLYTVSLARLVLFVRLFEHETRHKDPILGPNKSRRDKGPTANDRKTIWLRVVFVVAVTEAFVLGLGYATPTSKSGGKGALITHMATSVAGVMGNVLAGLAEFIPFLGQIAEIGGGWSTEAASAFWDTHVAGTWASSTFWDSHIAEACMSWLPSFSQAVSWLSQALPWLPITSHATPASSSIPSICQVLPGSLSHILPLLQHCAARNATSQHDAFPCASQDPSLACSLFGTALTSPWQVILQFVLSYAEFCIKSFVFEIVFDLAHYTLHRTCHAVPWLYRRVHRIHHKYLHPTPLSTYQQDLMDVFVSNMIPLLFAWLVVPLHFTGFQLHLLLVYKTFIEIAGHAGVISNSCSFPQCIWLPKLFGIEMYTDDHDLHHTRVHCNYSKRFTLWDKLFGTYLEPGGKRASF